jgi:hypothetical protein
LKSGSFNLLETSGPVQACNGIALSFTFRGGNTLFLMNVTTGVTYNNHRVKRLKFGEHYFTLGIRSATAYNIGFKTEFYSWKPHAYIL